MSQMLERSIPFGPIASFNGWKKVGRKVKKGEKALALWMPIIKTEEVERDDSSKEEVTKRFFVMKNHWFALAQTEPLDLDAEVIDVVPETPEWDKAKALKALGITEVPFDELNGNIQGFARPSAQQVAINPLAAMPLKTLFHEIAHCLLHGKEGGEVFVDGGGISRAIQEAEAEAVAYLCCASLGLPGLDECRGYIQDWLGSSEQAEEFRKKSARVFAAADKILKSGSVEEGGDE